MAHLEDRLAAQPLEGALQILAAADHVQPMLTTADGLSLQALLRQTLEVARERTCFQAHPAGVHTLAPSPKGVWFVSGGGRWLHSSLGLLGPGGGFSYARPPGFSRRDRG
ncbi:hypothetical protein [Trichothermofontia sp.]